MKENRDPACFLIRDLNEHGIVPNRKLQECHLHMNNVEYGTWYNYI